MHKATIGVDKMKSPHWCTSMIRKTLEKVKSRHQDPWSWLCTIKKHNNLKFSHLNRTRTCQIYLNPTINYQYENATMTHMHTMHASHHAHA